MTPSWELRPAGLDDLAAIVEIFRAEDLAYRGQSDMDLALVQERVAAEPSFDVERDLIVAELDGGVMATAIIDPRALNIAVHPAHDRAGLREDLLAWGERRQIELGRNPLHIAVPAANVKAVELYLASGYHLDRFYASMVRDFTTSGPPAAAQIPSGYRLRAIDPAGDITILHRLDDRAFAEQPDYQPETPEDFDRRHLSISTFAPEWSFVMESVDGSPAGSLIGARPAQRPRGYVAILAVDPDHRRRGIARALLSSALAAIHAAGLSTAELHVASDNARAQDLYLSAGMVEDERFDHYLRMP